MKYRLILLIVSSLMLMNVPSYASDASDAREVTWDDLIPAELHFDDPFVVLTDEQLSLLAVIAQYRDKQQNKVEISETEKVEYKETLEWLKTEDIDVDGLLARREEITEKRRASALKTNDALDGKQVRIPGYLLPLEFKDKKVTEFLLVPWVGACIHTPPPPPNQIVHVKLDKGFDIGDEMFTAVWVNGVMKTEDASPELSYVDGKQNIDVSYELQAHEVQPYEKK